jgi:tRNA modification GTPase
VVLAGLPNTGKSSLLNAMARREAAIVSSIPGTTRDVIEVSFDLGGIPVTLCDTAGLREMPADEVERIGIDRSLRSVADADVVVWVGAPDVAGSMAVQEGVSASLVVANKSDLGGHVVGGGVISVSTLDQLSVLPLLGNIQKLVEERYGRGENGLIVRARQRSAVMNSIRHLNDSLKQPLGRVELVAEELRAAAYALGRLTGAIDVEDLLGSIFSEFCIGK